MYARPSLKAFDLADDVACCSGNRCNSQPIDPDSCVITVGGLVGILC